MSNRIWKFCKAKVGWVSTFVGVNATPLSIRKNTRLSSDREAEVAKKVQAECGAYVKIMRSRCQDGREVDLNIMRSRCQGKCEATEADGNPNAKPMPRRPRSQCREDTRTRTRRMEVHTHTKKLAPNGNTQSYMFYQCFNWLLAFIIFSSAHYSCTT